MVGQYPEKLPQVQAAEEFWGQWISDMTFAPEVEEPMTHLTVNLRHEYALHPRTAKFVARQALETVLEAEQARQKEER